MIDKPDPQSPPQGLLEIAQAFRLAGWISFWSQVVLGSVAAVVLLFSGVSRDVAVANERTGTGLGIFFAFVGVITLAVSLFWAFRYTRIARQLQSSNPNNRPRKSDTIQLLRFGLIVNLAGLLITIVGALAIVGALLAKSLAIPQTGGGALVQIEPSRIIRPLDIFVVQANTNTIAAHFAGLVASIWLLNRINRSQQ